MSNELNSSLPSIGFRWVASVYIMLLAVSLYSLVLVDTLSTDKKQLSGTPKCYEDPGGCKPGLVETVIDQLKEIKKVYSNNVWTTLSSLILAIGLVLGSDRFREMIGRSRGTVVTVQTILVLLFILHAVSYGVHQYASAQYIDRLANLVGETYYYQSYEVQCFRVAINLVFDTVLFVLLAFIVDRAAKMKVDKVGG